MADEDDTDKPEDDEEEKKEGKKDKKKGADDADGGEGDDADGEGGEGKGKKKLSKKMVILIAGGAVGLVVLLVALFMMGVFTSSPDDEAAAEHKAADEAAETAGHGEAGKDGAKPDIGVVFHDLPDFLVNLNTGDKRTKFLKVSVTLEIKDAASLEIVKAQQPRIVDNFQVYLRELRPSDLQGSAGIYRLREELLRRVNETVQPVEINDILFKEMIVQ